jgi:hypothetical protein
MSLRLVFICLSLCLLSACTTTKVRPVETSFDTKHVCVKDCSDKCFDGKILGIIRDGLDRHGFTSQVFEGELPTACEYHLTYYCERTWDIATYLHHAELRLFQGHDQIGYAEYHLRGGGGLALTKFKSTKSKIDPVIDELLSGHSIR